MGLKTRTWALLVITLLEFAAPGAILAREEKPVSMEAIMEEIATVRTLVEAQQRQIEQVQAAVQPLAPAGPAAAVIETFKPQAPAANAQASDLEKKVDTIAGNLGGFKLSGDFRLRADVQARH